MGWTYGFRATDNLPCVHWDETVTVFRTSGSAYLSKTTSCSHTLNNMLLPSVSADIWQSVSWELVSHNSHFSSTSEQFQLKYEPLHYKTNLCAQWKLRSTQSDQSLCYPWRNTGLLTTYWAHSEDSDQEDSDQTGWMPKLSWVFAGAHVILLVLLCSGWYWTMSLFAQYRKNPKNSDTQTFCCNHPKCKQKGFTIE